jgi:hypothetical protein
MISAGTAPDASGRICDMLPTYDSMDPEGAWMVRWN